jgi:hypothetical protein
MNTFSKNDEKIVDKIEVIKQPEFNLKKVKIGAITIKPGHTLFKVNTETLEISKAEYKVDKVAFFTNRVQGNTGTGNKQVIFDPMYIYIPVLNKKNVMKVLVRDYGLTFNTIKNE